nr:MAG: hypothetical protein [Molluscum contagiosum virus]
MRALGTRYGKNSQSRLRSSSRKRMRSLSCAFCTSTTSCTISWMRMYTRWCSAPALRAPCMGK